MTNEWCNGDPNKQGNESCKGGLPDVQVEVWQALIDESHIGHRHKVELDTSVIEKWLNYVANSNLPLFICFNAYVYYWIVSWLINSRDRIITIIEANRANQVFLEKGAMVESIWSTEPDIEGQLELPYMFTLKLKFPFTWLVACKVDSIGWYGLGQVNTTSVAFNIVGEAAYADISCPIHNLCVTFVYLVNG